MPKTPKKKRVSISDMTDTSQDCIGSMFIDSGAHSLWNQYVGNMRNRKGYEKYDKPAFWDYVDKYAAWIKQHQIGIDYYANVDVIYDPERSWRVLKYLEQKHGLKPVPVLHWNASMKWLDRHLEEGYDYIGLGGLGQGVSLGSYYAWADMVFSRICPGPSNLPIVRVHGFAMTSYELLLRWPWWSVDSASWVKSGGFGIVMVPHKRGGTFTFDEKPYSLIFSTDSPSASNNEDGKHYMSQGEKVQVIMHEWLDKIGIPLGSVDEDGKMVEWGVVSHHAARKIANLKFFQALCKSLPEWPWPYTPRRTMDRFALKPLGIQQ